MPKLPPAANIDKLPTWVRYHKGLCESCRGSCCSLPVEVRFGDLERLGVADPFEAEEPLKAIARRLQKARIIQHVNLRSGVMTLTRLANGDCHYLDQSSRRCSVYARRPDTCRNHPRVGPRPGYCPYQPRSQSAAGGAVTAPSCC
jgi:Fe-S-cluster containining protein